MEQKKQQEIVKLYALRAGLSVLSEIADEAQNAKERIRIENEQIRFANRHIEENQEEIKATSKNRNQDQEDINNDIKAAKEKVENWQKEVKNAELQKEYASIKARKLKRFISFFVRYFIIALILELGALIVTYSLDPTFTYGPTHDETLLMIFNISMFVAIGTGAISMVVIPITAFIIFYQRDARHEAKEILKNAQTNLRYASIKLEVAEENYNKLLQGKKAKFESIAQAHETCIAEIQQEINYVQQDITHAQQDIENSKSEIAKANQELEVIKGRFATTYQAAQEEFSSFLDVRDWGNVDLIIFNYETGRALDLRDALLQVDNERRNERLVDAIGYASREISANIRGGFGALRSAIHSQMERLDRRISGFSSQVSQIAEKSAEKLAQQSNALQSRLGQIAAGISENTSSQQALLRKIDTSSTQMAEDIRYMQKLADRTYYNY